MCIPGSGCETTIQFILVNNDTNCNMNNRDRLNKSVLEFLQTHDSASIEEIANGIGWNINQVKGEIQRQSNSFAGDIIIEISNNLYKMHNNYKNVPIKELNHICNRTFGIDTSKGSREKNRLHKEILEQAILEHLI